MTGAALALALALLVAPSPRRNRLAALLPAVPASASHADPCVVWRRAVLALAMVVPVQPPWWPRRRSWRQRSLCGAGDRRRSSDAPRSPPPCRALWMSWSVNCGSARTRWRRSMSRPPRSTVRSPRRCGRWPRGHDWAPTWPRVSRSVAASSPSPAHWERLAVCWQLAQTHGLAIATLMRHRAARHRRARTILGARRCRRWPVPARPRRCWPGCRCSGVALGQLIGADPVRFLLSGGVGGWLLVVGVTLACCGLLWSDRITGRVLT